MFFSNLECIEAVRCGASDRRARGTVGDDGMVRNDGNATAKRDDANNDDDIADGGDGGRVATSGDADIGAFGINVADVTRERLYIVVVVVGGGDGGVCAR
jgi:hypothetical protein